MNPPTPEQLARLPKWAQSYIQDARRDAAIKLALRITDGAERDVEIPDDFKELAKGWDYNAHISGPTVRKACSNNLYHGDGWDEARYQHPKQLFSTRLLALRALRHEIELQAAKILAGIDLQIEEEQTNENKTCKSNSPTTTE